MNMHILIKRNDNKLALINSETGQTIKVISVDGTIMGSPNSSGEVGNVQVKKGNIIKMYVYDLKNGSVKKIYTV
jgi:hypothetical protein